ncbi:hypothetical protein EDC01DRAFT_633274 [Geopyxis carbonaria]|nr:hypothetical protein EDC01DRAFT_633274 [Geopyxis carbonaria]
MQITVASLLSARAISPDGFYGHSHSLPRSSTNNSNAETCSHAKTCSHAETFDNLPVEVPDDIEDGSHHPAAVPDEEELDPDIYPSSIPATPEEDQREGSVRLGASAPDEHGGVERILAQNNSTNEADTITSALPIPEVHRHNSRGGHGPASEISSSQLCDLFIATTQPRQDQEQENWERCFEMMTTQTRVLKEIRDVLRVRNNN